MSPVGRTYGFWKKAIFTLLPLYIGVSLSVICVPSVSTTTGMNLSPSLQLNLTWYIPGCVSTSSQGSGLIETLLGFLALDLAHSNAPSLSSSSSLTMSSFMRTESL